MEALPQGLKHRKVPREEKKYNDSVNLFWRILLFERITFPISILIKMLSANSSITNNFGFALNRE